VKEYLGGIRYFLEKRRIEDMRQIEARESVVKEQKSTAGKEAFSIPKSPGALPGFAWRLTANRMHSA
ncbi:MAG: hypothetical protein IJ992_04140, partial [Lentisphaeria bacterium]|nr:hypothetical protein [Lentisphaeria bacterium]